MIKISNFEHFNSIYNFNDFFNIFIRYLKNSEYITLPKGAIIDNKKYNKYLLFITSGILREYTILESGNESTIQFIEGRAFILFDENTTEDIEASKFLEVLESTSFFVIDKKVFFDNFYDFNFLQKIITRAFFDQIKETDLRIKLLLKKTTEQKYLSFTDIYPNISKIIPLSYIASYIGSTTESISRARKKVLEDERKGI